MMKIFYQSKLILVVLLLFILAVTVSCGDTPAETTESITTMPTTTSSVATTVQTTTTTLPVITTAPTTTETPTTTEAPDDAWKEKVEWGYDGNYPSSAYYEEMDKFGICIFIRDVHNIGQSNAEAAFAEKYGLYYNPNYGEPWITLGWRFIVQASEEEIEMYARLDEVEKIVFNCIDEVHG